jgi:hypothetical protein
VDQGEISAFGRAGGPRVRKVTAPPDGSVKNASLGGYSSVIGADGTVYALSTGPQATLTAYGP